MMDNQGAPAPMPEQAAGGGGQPMPVPAHIAQHIDPNNQVQMLLMQRLDKLSPQDLAACNSIPPAAVAVLKKVIPELGWALDMIGQQDGAMPAGGAAPMPQPAQAGGAPAPYPMRPQTKLGQV